MADKYGNPWPRYRVYPPEVLSPMLAVRHKCLDCCCELTEEVKLCPAEGCSLWPFRFGTYPTDHQGPKTVLRPIREKCRDCMPEPFKPGHAPVKDCERKCCPIYPYRLGTNPKLKGKGGTPPVSGQFKPAISSQPPIRG
jgi:hypothetical protein